MEIYDATHLNPPSKAEVDSGSLKRITTKKPQKVHPAAVLAFLSD